jgi:nitroreductase
MELIDAVTGRRSIRKFAAKEIPREIIREILATARWAPSWGNTQPWEFYVVTGKPLEAFRKENHALMAAEPSTPPDVPIPEVWPEHMKKRYGEVGNMLFTALDIKRDDKEARNRHYENMALLFGAPCLIVACIPRDTLVEYAMLDVGLILQTICLLAHEKGIGTCIMAMTIRHPAVLRRIISIPDDRRIIIGTVLGYPDENSPINHFERKRADIAEFVKWVDG